MSLHHKYGGQTLSPSATAAQPSQKTSDGSNPSKGSPGPHPDMGRDDEPAKRIKLPSFSDLQDHISRLDVEEWVPSASARHQTHSSDASSQFGRSISQRSSFSLSQSSSHSEHLQGASSLPSAVSRLSRPGNVADDDAGIAHKRRRSTLETFQQLPPLASISSSRPGLCAGTHSVPEESRMMRQSIDYFDMVPLTAHDTTFPSRDYSMKRKLSGEGSPVLVGLGADRSSATSSSRASPGRSPPLAAVEEPRRITRKYSDVRTTSSSHDQLYYGSADQDSGDHSTSRLRRRPSPPGLLDPYGRSIPGPPSRRQSSAQTSPILIQSFYPSNGRTRASPPDRPGTATMAHPDPQHDGQHSPWHTSSREGYFAGHRGGAEVRHHPYPSQNTSPTSTSPFADRGASTLYRSPSFDGSHRQGVLHAQPSSQTIPDTEFRGLPAAAQDFASDGGTQASYRRVYATTDPAVAMASHRGAWTSAYPSQQTFGLANGAAAAAAAAEPESSESSANRTEHSRLEGQRRESSRSLSSYVPPMALGHRPEGHGTLYHDGTGSGHGDSTVHHASLCGSSGDAGGTPAAESAPTSAAPPHLHHSSSTNSLPEQEGNRRGNYPRQVTEYLRAWLFSHRDHPYPTDSEKRELAHHTNLSMQQLNNWLINARRRLLRDNPALDSFAQPARPGPHHHQYQHQHQPHQHQQPQQHYHHQHHHGH